MPETTPRDPRDLEIASLRRQLRESEAERRQVEQRLHDLVHPPDVHEHVARAIYRATAGGVPFGRSRRRRGTTGVTVSAGALAAVALEAIAEVAEPLRPRNFNAEVRDAA